MDAFHRDSDFFRLFSFPLVEGTASSALAGPDDMAISVSMARLFFGSARAAAGRSLRMNNAQEMRITAVFADAAVTRSTQSPSHIASWIDLMKVPVIRGRDFSRDYPSDSNSVLISCLGLLGLTIFTAEQRRKEIGVRKVIGAGVGDIVLLLSRDIVRLIVLALVVALLTISYQSVRAATANPVKGLRVE